MPTPRSTPYGLGAYSIARVAKAEYYDVRGDDGKFSDSPGGGGAKEKPAPKKPKKAPAEKKPTGAEAQAANVASVGEVLNANDDERLGANGLNQLSAFADGKALSPEAEAHMVKQGLVKLDADGVATLTAEGRAVVTAAKKGDADAVGAALDNAGKRVNAAAGRQAAADAKAKEKTDAEAKAKADADAKAKEKEKKKGGGGGGGGEKKPDAADVATTARDAGQKAGLKPATVDALRDAADGKPPTGKLGEAMRAAGLSDADGLTPAGRKVVQALEKGDARGVVALIADARRGARAAGAKDEVDAERRAIGEARAAREREMLAPWIKRAALPYGVGAYVLAKHGSHNQKRHGRATARRKAGRKEYAAARAEGADVATARQRAKDAGAARVAERDARARRMRDRKAQGGTGGTATPVSGRSDYTGADLARVPSGTSMGFAGPDGGQILVTRQTRDRFEVASSGGTVGQQSRQMNRGEVERLAGDMRSRGYVNRFGLDSVPSASAKPAKAPKAPKPWTVKPASSSVVPPATTPRRGDTVYPQGRNAYAARVVRREGNGFFVRPLNATPGSMADNEFFVPNNQISAVATKFATADDLAKRAPSPLSAYAPISKADEGERLVYGVASTSIVDDQPGVWEGRRYDGDLVEPAAMREALASYWGNLRAMHEGAAGRALDVTVADDGNTYLVAKVTDDDAWRSVRERVYQGFSIGGRVLKAHLERVGGRLVRRITKLLLTEISLVDRPANPQAAILVYKRHPQGGDMDENETITTPPGEGGAALDALADLAGDDVLEKAGDPKRAIALIQQLRNDAELEGDLEAAERYTQAIGLLLIASGGADAGDIDEDLAEEEEEAGVDLEALGAEGEGDEDPAEAAKVLKSGRKIAASRMALLKSALMTYAKALADAGDEDAAKMLKALAPGDEPAADAETMKALVADELKKALGPADSGLQTVARAVLALGDQLKTVAGDVAKIAAQPVGGGPAIRLAPALAKRLGTEETVVAKRAEDDPTKRRAIYALEQRLATENNPTTRAQYQAELRKLLGE